jgi:23S rRNA (guanosine2251-2'-O)-methyltransferase
MVVRAQEKQNKRRRAPRTSVAHGRAKVQDRASALAKKERTQKMGVAHSQRGAVPHTVEHHTTRAAAYVAIGEDQRRPSAGPAIDTKSWIWGWHACRAALGNPHRVIKKVWVTNTMHDKVEALSRSGDVRAQGAQCEVVKRAALDQKLPGYVHQGIACETTPLVLPYFARHQALQKGAQTPQLWVALDSICDPHNVGAVLRNALALGASGVLCAGRLPPLGGVVAKTASGALDRLDVCCAPNLALALKQAQKAGFWCFGLAETGRPWLDVFPADQAAPQRILIVMGAEGAGLRSLTTRTCDQLVCLPTNPAFPTLNVSSACAVALGLLKARPRF